MEKWLPNILERKPIYIGILLFGFLNFLWLTCKAPSQIGDLNQATKSILQAYSSSGSSWVLDSGCTNHMTRERSMFSSYSLMTHSNENVVFGDNSKGDVIGLYKVAITLEHSITNVLHVDSLSYNLLSISQLYEMGYNCLFLDKGVEVFRREDFSIVFTYQLKNKLYSFHQRHGILSLSRPFVTPTANFWC